MNKSENIEPASGNDSTEVSKSQRKREAHILLELAKTLISMPENRFKRLPMDKDLHSEVGFARHIRSHGARKRQLMTVAKMLRNRDAGPLLEAVNNIDEKNRQATAHHHHVEAWRDRLIEGDNHALAQLLAQIPATNAQTIRQLIRNAGKEATLGKPPAAARKLFKLLCDIDKQESLPPLV